VSVGLIVLVIVLGGSLAAGLTWRQRNGVMRAPRRPAARRRAGESAQAGGLPPESGLAPETGLRSEPVLRQGGTEPAVSGPAITSAELGVPLGTKATLVQFSSAFCAPCRATRRVLTEVAGMTDGVAHVEIDAESRLDLVRSLDVRRTPTVFVLGPDGQIAKQASGQPRKADVIAALGEVT
jgi:thiol-disulfide isomerase/thioredoxin